MPSPTSASGTSIVPETLYDPHVDALLSQLKWGGGVGAGASLTYSFPWLNGSGATFAGYNGAVYSTLGENTAAYHFGLTATQQAAARSALANWATFANVTFTEVADTASNVGDIRFAWTSATRDAGGSAAWGWAGYPDGYWPSGGDVWISTQSSAATNTDWSAGSANYKSLLHEIGHALGLKHPFDGDPTLSSALDNQKYSLMSYTGVDNLFVRVTAGASGSVSYSSFYVQPDTPMLFDIAAIQYMYGANLAYHTGNDVYTFDPNTPFLRTIWDAGGTDTISVANFSKPCLIDLRAGQFSTITIESDSTAGYNWRSPPPVPTYDDTDNLAIAFGCTIENAAGGQGSDLLIGNDVGNSIDGGDGNDVMYGGPGDDLFDWQQGQRSGADTFYGGLGNDNYVLDSASDTIVEYANEGYDTAWVSFSYSMIAGSNLEQVSVYGSTGVRLTGNAANNAFEGNTGNDTIEGGAGVDAAVYSATRSSYTITKVGSAFTVAGPNGTDTLSGIERLEFSDVNLALDIDGNAGQGYRIYQAAFNRTPDAGGLGYWINALDSGASLRDVALGFVNSAEFKSVYGASPTNAQLVTKYYENVLHRAPEAGGYNYWLGVLDQHQDTAAGVLASISESPENQAGVIGAIQNGIVYTV